jgi:hypothetical protein
MPSTDRKLELKAKTSVAQTASQAAVYAKGLKQYDRVKEERNIVHTVNKMKANCIGHISRTQCLLIHFTEGKIEGRIEMTRRRGRRRTQFLDHLKVRKVTGNLKRKH